MPTLPDLLRRSPYYKVNVQEPLIRDDMLTEQWYSLGKYMLATEETVSAAEYMCGTKYPIVLSGKVTKTRF